MAERPEVVGPVPTVAAQILVTLARHLVSSPGASCPPPRTRRRKPSIGTGGGKAVRIKRLSTPSDGGSPPSRRSVTKPFDWPQFPTCVPPRRPIIQPPPERNTHPTT